MNDLTDEQLMLMFRYGDRGAFELIFEKYRQPLFRYLYHLCHDCQTAEDLLQDVFLKIIRASYSYEPRGLLSSWIYRIATNHAINYLGSREKHWRGRVISLSLPVYADQDKEGQLSDTIESRNSYSPEKNIQETELREVLSREITLLPEKYREVFVLRDIEGKDYQEIADILEIPLGTVKTHLHRARTQLAQAMSSYFKPGEEDSK